VVTAPAFDEEHPDELSYRPFPIAPLLTATASIDDPALVQIVHPDFGKVLELLEQPETVPPMRLRPGRYEAETLLARQSEGMAVDISLLTDPGPAAQPARPPVTPGGTGSAAALR
jgi:hypothetical protein